jgi:hypothetical protein
MKRFLLLLAACGSGGDNRHAEIPIAAPSEYPGELHAPATLHPDFMVRQTLTIHTQHDGKPIDAELDAVLQKQADTLLILGFGPMNTKAFTLTEKADKITFDQFMGPQLPFSPRNIVVDVHRVFFMRLPPPADPKFSGTQQGELDGEHVEETWKDGELRAVVFTRPGDPKLKGAIRVQLSEGCTAALCQPVSATLRNEWFGYTLGIKNEDFEKL